MNTSKLLLSAAAILLAGAVPAHAAWQPQKPIEFVATAGPGGGTDNLARAVQSIVTKYKLIDQPIVVVNKGGGSGAEGYVYGKASAGDPYKVIFGTSNAWQHPLWAFSPKRLPQGPKVTATEGWSDVPTCAEQGLAITQYEQPRTVWLPGKVSPEQAAFYVDLMKKVQATPEWKDYIEKTSQVDTCLTCEECEAFIT